MRSPDQILSIYTERKGLYAPLHAKMREINDVYNGRAEVPLTGMDREDEKASVPNLLQQGVDQMAGRVSSVIPQVTFASKEPGKRKWDRNAHAASQTVTGWWQMDKLPLKQKVRARRLIAYAMSPTVMRWDYKEHRPTWEVRHPMEALPSPDLIPGQVRPTDCVFQFRRSAGWMSANGYGEQLWRLAGGRTPEHDAVVTLLEYIDADHTVLMATGYYPSNQVQYGMLDDGNLKGVVLEAYQNFGDDAPVIIPTRLTLDQMTGQFDGMIGMYYQQAKLMALETIAVEKGIFPDTYLVSRPGEVGRFLDGPHDGRSGLINIIAGGDIKTDQVQPGYQTNNTIDRLERAQRVTSGIPAEFGGESQSNVRTGRRGDAILSATIDFPIAEAQEIFAYAMEEENESAISMAKRIDGDTKRTIYVGTGNSRKPVTYVPTETFEVSEHVVSYPAAGSDINQLMIGIGQRIGMGTMSKQTAAYLDPYIDSPELEHDTIISEGLEQALMAGIQQQASSGQIPPLVLSKIMKLVKTDKLELAEAMEKVTAEAMKEQEAQQQGQPATTPDMAMAGAAAQAMTGADAMSPIPGVSPGQEDLSTLLGALRRPVMSVQPMRGMDRGAV